LPVTAPIKPFVDVTGPEKVVDAMIFPYIQVKCASLYVVSRDCLAHRKARITAFIPKLFKVSNNYFDVTKFIYEDVINQ